MSIKRFQLSLFIFRRDLRLHDNTALIEALRQSELVIPCFIFDDRQIKLNSFFSSKAFQFMLESLKDLDLQIKKSNGKLYLLSGEAEKVVQKLISTLPIDAVYFNRDYTPFSINRDDAIKRIVEKNKRHCFVFSDALLNEPEAVAKQNGSPYTIFTPFSRKSRTLSIAKPRNCIYKNFYNGSISEESPSIVNQYMKNHFEKNIYKGGRTHGKILLRKVNELKNYAVERDFPCKDSTSHLSAHHKFGTISIRESYKIYTDHFKKMHFVNELYWRDFFTHIAFHFPRVFEEPFQLKFKHINWSNRDDFFEVWCRGETGFPMVDAGMRELNETGFMHNRVRMITASFLVKDLHIDWRWGERYFARKLIDYDPSVNNGNWQWVASTGCDAQPYFRIFNPWLQQKRFDGDALYIKKWVPELKDIPRNVIHDPIKLCSYQLKKYKKPIIDHFIESKIAKALYKKSALIFDK